MKRLIFFMSCLFLLALPVTSLASDVKDASGVAITVVIPQNDTEKEIKPPETKVDVPNYLYPISISEQMENGQRMIVKTYELGEGEKPEDISRESFVRDGWLYELTDIVKKESATTDGKEHVEKVTLDSATNNTEAILSLFNPTIEYSSEDGYYGVLGLDIASIKIETAGTKKESFTANVTREYPHLSSNDSSLVPKTVTDNGKEYTLVSVDWKAQNNTTIDYTQIADSYTAVAKYTRTGYRNVTTGYAATAEYKGNIAKVITGKTLYIAYFYGVQIVSPAMGIVPNIPSEETPESITTPDDVEIVTDKDIKANTKKTAEMPMPSVAPEAESKLQVSTESPKSINPLFLFGFVMIGIGIGGGFVYLFLHNKKRRDEAHEETS